MAEQTMSLVYAVYEGTIDNTSNALLGFTNGSETITQAHLDAADLLHVYVHDNGIKRRLDAGDAAVAGIPISAGEGDTFRTRKVIKGYTHAGNADPTTISIEIFKQGL